MEGGAGEDQDARRWIGRRACPHGVGGGDRERVGGAAGEPRHGAAQSVARGAGLAIGRAGDGVERDRTAAVGGRCRPRDRGRAKAAGGGDAGWGVGCGDRVDRVDLVRRIGRRAGTHGVGGGDRERVLGAVGEAADGAARSAGHGARHRAETCLGLGHGVAGDGAAAVVRRGPRQADGCVPGDGDEVGRLAGHDRHGSRSECAGAIGCAQPCRTVIAGDAAAEIGDGTAVIGDIVVATYHVVQVGGVSVQVARRVGSGRRAAGQGIDGGNDRRRGACASCAFPAAVDVDGHISRRIGNGRDIGLGSIRTPGVVLPGGLGLVRRTATARSSCSVAPGRLGPATGARVSRQARAADRNHIW